VEKRAIFDKKRAFFVCATCGLPVLGGGENWRRGGGGLDGFFRYNILKQRVVLSAQTASPLFHVKQNENIITPKSLF
jgi:hypothetical protein